MELERCLQLRTHRGLAEDLSLAPSMHIWLTTPFPGDLMSFSDFFGLLHEHGTHKLSQAYIHTHKHRISKYTLKSIHDCKTVSPSQYI